MMEIFLIVSLIFKVLLNLNQKRFQHLFRIRKKIIWIMTVFQLILS